ncbi:MAG: hypothetical protein KKB51_02350 [Candidatus Riflebacteria bacterium]|nr:hypothetical protein [Candidatus Riflebacteria bacterium]
MLEGTSVPKANYTFEVLDVEPAEVASYITVYEESGTGIAMVSVYGYQSGVIMHFTLKATHNTSGAILMSGPQSVIVSSVPVSKR